MKLVAVFCFFLGVVLGIGSVNSADAGLTSLLKLAPGIGLLVFIFDSIGLIFVSMATHNRPTPQVGRQKDGGFFVFHLALVTAVGIVVGIGKNPLWGFLYALAVLASVMAYLALGLSFLLVLEFSSRDYLTGKRWNNPFRR